MAAEIIFQHLEILVLLVGYFSSRFNINLVLTKNHLNLKNDNINSIILVHKSFPIKTIHLPKYMQSQKFEFAILKYS